MPVRSPSSSRCVLLLLASACGEPDDKGMTEASSGSSTAGAASGTQATDAASTGATGSASGPGGDVCPDRPAGEWNACKVGGQIDNGLCGGDAAAAVSCLSPTSGGFNVCGLEGCVDDCDCFAPPATGDAVVFCAPLFGDGAKACALYCAGGQTCPDGMQCEGGYCFWPD